MQNANANLEEYQKVIFTYVVLGLLRCFGIYIKHVFCLQFFFCLLCEKLKLQQPMFSMVLPVIILLDLSLRPP